LKFWPHCGGALPPEQYAFLPGGHVTAQFEWPHPGAIVALQFDPPLEPAG
jgi:hypothetical protein